MRYQIQSLALSVQRRGGVRWSRIEGWALGPAPPPPPPPPPSGTITPSLRVSYVPEGGGARTSVYAAADGSTTLNVTVPALLFFDATGTRCSATAVDEIDAWWRLRYRMSYDEAPGTWPISGMPSHYDEGEPIFGKVIETAGTKTFQLTVKNSNGTIAVRTITVVASNPPAPTVIELAAGSWPSWVDGTHYALRGDGNYLSFGDMEFAGHRDIIVSKIGAGADPQVSGFTPDNRDALALGAVQAPSRNIRLVDIDVSRYFNGSMGPQFCGIVRGRARTYEASAYDYLYEHGALSDVQRANLRFPRGVFLWKTGDLRCALLNQYVMISAFRELVMQGVRVIKDGPTGNHALRNSGFMHVYRHSQALATVSSASIVKHQAGNGQTAWVDDEDSVGTTTGARLWDHRPTSHLVMDMMLYHDVGSVIPDICVGAGAENNDVGYGHGVIQFCAFSNSRSAQNAWQSVAGLDVQVNGKAHSTRNIRLLDGTTYVTQSAGAYENNVPVDMRGPYLYETVDTRPVI